jgi:hypothetical protein
MDRGVPSLDSAHTLRATTLARHGCTKSCWNSAESRTTGQHWDRFWSLPQFRPPYWSPAWGKESLTYREEDRPLMRRPTNRPFWRPPVEKTDRPLMRRPTARCQDPPIEKTDRSADRMWGGRSPLNKISFSLPPSLVSSSFIFCFYNVSVY